MEKKIFQDIKLKLQYKWNKFLNHISVKNVQRCKVIIYLPPGEWTGIQCDNPCRVDPTLKDSDICDEHFENKCMEWKYYHLCKWYNPDDLNTMDEYKIACLMEREKRENFEFKYRLKKDAGHEERKNLLENKYKHSYELSETGYIKKIVYNEEDVQKQLLASKNPEDDLWHFRCLCNEKNFCEYCSTCQDECCLICNGIEEKQISENPVEDLRHPKCKCEDPNYCKYCGFCEDWWCLICFAERLSINAAN